MHFRPYLRGLVALLVSISLLGGGQVAAQDGVSEPVTTWSPVLNATCEGFTFSHPNFESVWGVPIGYEYQVTGSVQAERQPYTPNTVLVFNYDDTSISHNSQVTVWANYEGQAFSHQIGQIRAITDPCVVKPPFEGVTTYIPVVNKTCEGFTFSHPEFMHSSMGVAVQYEYQITGEGATEVLPYEPNSVISVTYADNTVSNDSQVSLFATYENDFRHQLGQSRIISEPCVVPEAPEPEEEEPGDNGEDPDNGGEVPGDDGEDPGNGAEEPGNEEETPVNGGDEPGNTEEDPVGEDTITDETADESTDVVDADVDADPVEVTELPVVGTGTSMTASGGIFTLAVGAMVTAAGALVVRKNHA